MPRPATRRTRLVVALGATAAVVGLLAACTSSSDAPPGTSDRDLGAPATRSDDELSGTVTVLAAASLTESLTELEERFEQHHPALEVRLSFGGSSMLAQQVLAGAPADVLATADAPTMAIVTDAGAHAAEPALLVRNVLELAVPPDDPTGITALADVAREGVTFAMCAVEVPCGATSEALLAAAGVTAEPVTYERDVRAVLMKVRLGEVDAGLVYRTDVAAAGDAVVGIPVPEAERPTLMNDYLVVPLAEAPNPAAAAAFVAFVLGDDGREVFSEAGFVLP